MYTDIVVYMYVHIIYGMYLGFTGGVTTSLLRGLECTIMALGPFHVAVGRRSAGCAMLGAVNLWLAEYVCMYIIYIYVYVCICMYGRHRLVGIFQDGQASPRLARWTFSQLQLIIWILPPHSQTITFVVLMPTQRGLLVSMCGGIHMVYAKYSLVLEIGP